MKTILIIFSFVLLTSCTKDNIEEPQTETSGTFTDSRDSKTYKWLKIGEQKWMTENLNYTGNNDFQQKIINDNQWNNTTYNGWCYYENNDDNTIYGALYQWEAAIRACPEGWHLPTAQEWAQLEDYLKNNAYSFDSVVGNEGIAKSMTAIDYWTLYPPADEGTPGNSDYPEVRNKSGFTALPSGNRNPSGVFVNMGGSTNWWTNSTNQYNENRMHFESISWYSTSMIHFHNIKSFGFSVRCIKD
jgi:uncharacterized protein (TIGR02145 family)